VLLRLFYYDRAAIEAGALDGQNLEICWLKDPSDLLTIQIQGSGRVILEDGTPLRISYDSYNDYSCASSSSSRPDQAQSRSARKDVCLIFCS
jgi:membrane-bound lytic murein transglycosylase